MAENASSSNILARVNEKHVVHYQDNDKHEREREQQYGKAKSQDLPFYPAFCFPASPTHFTWVKMSIADIHRLRGRSGFEGQNILFYNNHPIQFVCLAGYIVSREDYERRTVLNVDDSSGAILELITLKAPVKQDAHIGNASAETETAEMTHITSTARTPIDITELRIGTAVKIKGTLSCKLPLFQTTNTQVILERFWVLCDTSAEIKFWNERSRFLMDVLSKPWCLTEDEIASLRQQARVEQGRAMKERQRMQERKKRLEGREQRYQRRIVRRWQAEEKLREKESERVRESNKRWLASKGLIG
ncbi:hypothetical protein UA08_03209 [Talaromyces atroroseus]|uniref:CST complex subunit Stn1 N-terminal domain-containing protein n=1 Tax=Talaromyces atroroseus TaxID=1441469 RepID=A0A225APA0_TALAT|nr:hypothetical protein UA08_03209 [Talaromyces atroroseus]OKL61303.1 hypothetical protein UA08_03209 [Talaromyces atroroseus]